jgi:SanA protein
MASSQERWTTAFKRVLVAVSSLGLLGVIFATIAHLVMWHRDEGRLHEQLAQVPPKTVAIVLGALVYPKGRLSDTVSDRVACGLALYRAGKVKRILVSGDHGRRDYDEVNAMADALVRDGVPPQHVFLDHAGFRTLDSMHRAAAVFGVHDAVVCTQRFHLTRAVYLATHFGIDAHGLVADRRPDRSALYNGLRERLAVTAALLDVVLGRRARLLGPPLSIHGDGRSSRD